MAELARHIRAKCAPLIRLLASPVDGEVLGAARGLGRVLRANDCDIHDLAAVVEGNRVVEFSGSRTSSANTDWRAKADWCAAWSDRLPPKDAEFLRSIRARRWSSGLTFGQQRWLDDIVGRLKRTAA